jgi:hypothetical protein
MLRAGDRAPDATGLVTADGERRLFDLTRGGRFTLLSFGDAPAIGSGPVDLRMLRVVSPAAAGESAIGGNGATDVVDTVVQDAAGQLASEYGATERTLVLIRPDGYVALISDAGDVAAVVDYLSAIG